MLYVLLNITYGIAVSLSFYSIGWLLHRGSKTYITASFILCQALIILWCATQFFAFLNLTDFQRLVVYDISYLGICFIGPAWLVFCLLYGGRPLKMRDLILISLLPALHYLALLTNPLHHLFYPAFHSGRVTYGPLFYTNAAAVYGYILWGVVVLWKSLHRDPVNHPQMKMVAASVAIPMVLNLMFLFGWIKPGFDVTPPAFSVTCGLLLLATYRFNFLNVNTLATNQVFETISEGILIYNSAGAVTYSNRVAEEMFPVKKGGRIQDFFRLLGEMNGTEAEEKDLEYPSGQMPGSVGGLLSGEAASLGENRRTLLMRDGRTVEMETRIHLDKKGRMTAGTVILSDVTRYYELVERTRELAASNEQLAVEKERNRIAQEVHDTTGHTLTMIRSLLKLAWLEGAGEKSPELTGYLEEAQKLAGDGLRELRCSINHLKKNAGGELVSQSLRRLAASVRELTAEVCIQGADSGRYSHLTGIVYECAREAVTNCLKYGNASHMDFIVKFHEESLDFYIFDNGRGCGKIVPGNGLEGMERRVRYAGGQFRAVSNEGEGFQITIKLPVLAGVKETVRDDQGINCG